jgi:mono/diheme cytochrome c family protein
MFTMIQILAGLSISPSWAGTPPSTPEAVEKGKAVYSTNCLTCHGEKGDGNGPAGAYMNPKPRDLAKGRFKKGEKPEQVFKTISSGLEGTSMTAFSHLPEDDRWNVTYYILSTFKKGGKK